MALISRWEVSNFLDSSKRQGWSPDFVGEKIDFGGLSAAMVMDNGTGKTSIVEAELWLLSLDRALLKKTAPRVAPASAGYSSHIRVEFVIPRADYGADLFARYGSRVEGEHWVFGAYCVREPGGQIDHHLYRYQGVLEDVPAHIEQIDGTGTVLKAPISDQAFADSLPEGGLVRRNADWLALVDEFWPLQQLRQVVDYQKRGGGDKAASFYDVRARGTEKFDQAFFRQFVAPEILRGVIEVDEDVEGSRDRSFETGLVDHANEVVKAKLATEDKAKRLDAMRRGHEALQKIVTAAGRYVSERRRLKETIDRHRRNVSATKAVLEGNRVPGLPLVGAALEPVLPAAREILLGTGFRPGGSIMVERHLLTDLVVAGFGVNSEPDREILPCAIAAQPERRKGGFFDLDRLAALADKQTLPDSEHVKSKLEAIRRTVLTHTTQGRRGAADEAARRLGQTRETIRLKGETATGLLAEIADLQSKFSSYLENEKAFTRLKLSEFFTEAQLADPLALQAALKGDKAKAEAALEAHVIRVEHLRTIKEIYDQVVAEFSPSALDEAVDALAAALREAKERHATASAAYAKVAAEFQTLKERKAKIDAAVLQAEQEINEMAKLAGTLDRLEAEFGAGIEPGKIAEELRSELEAAARRLAAVEGERELRRKRIAELDTAIGRLDVERRNLSEEAATLELLAGAHETFTRQFPNRTPAGFAEEVEREIAAADQQKSAAEREQTSLAPLAAALEAFQGRTGGADPAAWIEEATKRRSFLLAEQRELETMISDLDRRLVALERNPVAPSQADHVGHEAMRGLPWTPLHRAIEALPVDASRRRALLSHFSALLFAPVFEDASGAAQAASRLSQAELSMPVFVASDVAGWAKGTTALPIIEENALYHGIMGGLSTRAVEAILDPTLVERDRADVISRKSEAQARLDEIVTELAALDPEGPILVEARFAQRAVKENAVARIAELASVAAAANRRAKDVRALLNEDNRRLAASAADYLRRGGQARLVTLREALSELDVRLGTMEADRITARAEETELAAVLPGAKERLNAAQSRRHWIETAEQCQAFIVSGGRSRLAEWRNSYGELLLQRAQLEADVTRAFNELTGCGEAQGEADEMRHQAALRWERWGEKIRTASSFVRDGSLAYLTDADRTERDLRHEVKTFERHLEFDFTSAAEYVAVMGTGIDDFNRQIDEKQKARERLQQEITALQEELPGREVELDRLRRESDHLERAALVLYRATVKPYELQLEGGDDPTATTYFQDRIADLAAALDDDTHFHEAMAAYEEIATEIEGYNLANARDEIRRAERGEADANEAYRGTIADRTRPEDTPFDAGLLERVRALVEKPEDYVALARTVESGIQRERLTWEKARDEEARSREKLIELLRGLAITAGENLRTMTRVMAPKTKDSRYQGAGFLIEADIAAPEEIDRVLGEIVEEVERSRKRFDEDAARGEDPSEKDFRENISARVRGRIYERMFPNARIKVVHPLMRSGRSFYFVKEGISGGQATALMLLWTIKLAAYWIERSAARKRGAQRRKIRNAANSIIIVDGLFSDLSDPPLIRQSMDAMKKIRGGFQLIGLIHSPYYRNDWELFPTCLMGRTVSTVGEDGTEGKMVTIQSAPDDRPGRVSVGGLRARSTLQRNDEEDADALQPESASDEVAE